MQLIRRWGEQGDTIVEVLIAIAVVSGVLGTSYAIVSRNTKSYQQVNEHTDALKIAETQFERVRQIAAGPVSSDETTLFADNSSFCFDDSGTLKTGSNVPCTSNGRYKVSVTKPGSGRTFNVLIQWDGINGGTDQVGLSYKVYQ